MGNTTGKKGDPENGIWRTYVFVIVYMCFDVIFQKLNAAFLNDFYSF